MPSDRSAEPSAPSNMRPPYNVSLVSELSRAVVSRPRLIPLDMRTAGMNASETDGVGDEVSKLNESEIGIVLVAHKMQLISDLNESVVSIVFVEHKMKRSSTCPIEWSSSTSDRRLRKIVTTVSARTRWSPRLIWGVGARPKPSYSRRRKWKCPEIGSLESSLRYS
jgi:hypothetical protein